MTDANKLKADLGHFTGTEAYHGLGALFPKVCLTDGAAHLAVEGNCMWLMTDSAALLQTKGWEAEDGFVTVRLVVNPDKSFVHTLEDGNDGVKWSNTGNWTDFPFSDGIVLFGVYDEGLGRWVLMLTSEY